MYCKRLRNPWSDNFSHVIQEKTMYKHWNFLFCRVTLTIQNWQTCKTLGERNPAKPQVPGQVWPSMHTLLNLKGPETSQHNTSKQSGRFNCSFCVLQALSKYGKYQRDNQATQQVSCGVISLLYFFAHHCAKILNCALLAHYFSFQSSLPVILYSHF